MQSSQDQGSPGQDPQPSTETTPTTSEDPRQYLLPDSDEKEPAAVVNEVRVQDKGSHPQSVRVVVAGVPVDGIVDTAADITIVGAETFKRIAAVAKLRKRGLKPADKTPRTYDQKTFRLDGRLDLDITFQERTMKTPVYVKMDAKEQLLLSEGVCRQLGIMQYHEQVSPGDNQEPVCVPMVRVHLVQTVKLGPNESLMAEVRLVGEGVGGGRKEFRDSTSERNLLLLESGEELGMKIGARITASLVKPSADGVTQVLIYNSHSVTHRIPEGTEIGQAAPVEIVEPEEPTEEQPYVNSISDETMESESKKHRMKQLITLLQDKLRDIPKHDRMQLVILLEKYSDAFSVTEGERGETNWTEMHINTGDAVPKKQPVRRVPFAVRQEVAKQLAKEEGVIQPSSSPLASAIVLVRKKDGTLRICVDYRQLNSVTKLDTFSLPRIDDLLDQLGNAKYFTTLDLAAGYWQIRVADDSIEKTAFITHGGLYEFRVMPFGLTNAPAVFQRLMQQVLQGLNPAEGPSFVSVFLCLHRRRADLLQDAGGASSSHRPGARPISSCGPEAEAQQVSLRVSAS